jgi:molybdopterin-synthase adenylyltransferase
VNPRYERQDFLGKTSDQVLKNLRIAIVGLGGGGAHIAQQLAHVGVGHFVLFDPDRIEESNLNRLVGGSLADVREEEWKVQISSRYILSVNPEADLTLVKQKWQEKATLLRDCDVIFGCVDSFAARNELERVARRYLIPYMDIGIDVHRIDHQYFVTGQAALSMPGEACLHCMKVLREDLLAREAAEYGDVGGRPQVVWCNGVLASIAVGIMVQLVSPWHDNSRPPCLLEYDGNLHEVRVSSSAQFLRDTFCSHFVLADDLGDPWYGRSDR